MNKISNPEIFSNQGYVLVPDFLDEATVDILTKYFQYKTNSETWVSDRQDESSKLNEYSDPLIEVILEKKILTVEEYTGLELLPSYTYSRIYTPGEELKPHVDRPSCEISVTVSVYNKEQSNPICMHYGSVQHSCYYLKPGEAVIYKGCEALHWRPVLKENELVVQFMLHYLNKNGPYADFIYDRRPYLGFKKKKTE